MYDVRQTIDELQKIRETMENLLEEFPEGSPGAFVQFDDAYILVEYAIDLLTNELKVIDGMEGG